MSQSINNATDGLTTGTQTVSTMVFKTAGSGFLTYDPDKGQETTTIADLTFVDDDFNDRREYRGP